MTHNVASRLRVLVATNMFPHEGDPASGAFVKAQVDALRALGPSVDVFHIRGDRGTLNYATAIPGMRRAAQRFDATIVYAFYGLTGWVALWQPRPMVLSLAGDDVLGTPNGRGSITVKSRIGVALSQWAAHRAAAVCVQSEEMRDKLWGRDLRRRALVVPYGVDPGRFYPSDQTQARLRLRLPAAERLVIFPNTPTEPRKRLDLAEAAMVLVRRVVPDAVLRVVTRIPHDQMPDYYRAADCCLLTSDWEGSPNVVKEALLSGLPVVSTDVGDVRKWLMQSPESAVCDRTPEALAQAIGRVLQDRRRANPVPFMSALSSMEVAKHILTLFEEVLADRPTGVS